MSKSDILEDYLDEDPEISGQKYALVSFISPENILESKDQFFFERFLQNYEVNWKVKNLEHFLADTVKGINDKLSDNAKKFEKEGQTESADLCRSSYIKIDSVLGEYQSFVAKSQKDINRTKLAEDYKDYMFKEQKKLDDEFHSINKFQTTIRGFKVRAVVRDEKEAEVRAKKLQSVDKVHNIFMAEIGKWTPWDPAPNAIERQEYAQDELNKLMRKYRENEQDKNEFFEEMKRNASAGSKKSEEPGPKKVIEVISDNEPVLTNTVVGGGVSANYSGLFDSPDDLVLQRKMAASEKKTE